MDAMASDATGFLPAPEDSWGDALRAPFEAVAAGDRDALETVWLLASRRLYALALWRTGDTEEAADVVQEVFVRLASSRTDLRGVKAPHLWLLAVAHRAASHDSVDAAEARWARNFRDASDSQLRTLDRYIGAR